MDKVVDIREAEADLLRLVELVEAGEKITLERAGRPVARIVPYGRRHAPRRLGPWKGKVWAAEDWDSGQTNAEISREFDG